jgi:hypothetical protein
MMYIRISGSIGASCAHDEKLINWRKVAPTEPDELVKFYYGQEAPMELNATSRPSLQRNPRCTGQTLIGKGIILIKGGAWLSI